MALIKFGTDGWRAVIADEFTIANVRKVALATVDSENDALALYDRARFSGYAVSIKPIAAEGGGYRYAVRVSELPSKAEAEILSSKLAGALALAAPTVTRY